MTKLTYSEGAGIGNPRYQPQHPWFGPLQIPLPL